MLEPVGGPWNRARKTGKLFKEGQNEQKLCKANSLAFILFDLLGKPKINHTDVAHVFLRLEVKQKFAFEHKESLFVCLKALVSDIMLRLR